MLLACYKCWGLPCHYVVCEFKQWFPTAWRETSRYNRARARERERDANMLKTRLQAMHAGSCNSEWPKHMIAQDDMLKRQTFPFPFCSATVAVLKRASIMAKNACWIKNERGRGAGDGEAGAGPRVYQNFQDNWIARASCANVKCARELSRERL